MTIESRATVLIKFQNILCNAHYILNKKNIYEYSNSFVSHYSYQHLAEYFIILTR